MVAVRGAVAQQHVVQAQQARQAADPVQLRRGQRVPRMGVGRRQGGRIAEQLPLVVAGDGRQPQREQPLQGLARPQRAGGDVAQVDDAVAAAPGDVVEHCIQCRQVAVDVRQCGQTHR